MYYNLARILNGTNAFALAGDKFRLRLAGLMIEVGGVGRWPDGVSPLGDAFPTD